ALSLVGRRRIDLVDQLVDAALDHLLQGVSVVEGDAVVRVLALELREAALGWIGAAVELVLRLVLAIREIRIRRLARSLGLLLAREERVALLRDALVLADQALALRPRRGVGRGGREQHEDAVGRASQLLRHDLPPR